MGEDQSDHPAKGDPLRRIDASLYDELRAIASSALRGENSKTSPGTTSLVHEVWLRLARSDRNPANDQQHLLALASLVARRALVDAARAASSLKRGERKAPGDLPADFAAHPADPAEIILVDELLQRLAADHPRQAKALEMRIFGGISPDRIAIALGVSATQAKRDVAFARTWLVTQLDAQRTAEATETKPKSTP